ncbi:TonB-dependent receptor [Elizabethkingia anophelis]|uniref:TonB-dependent receptor n=1 Tax=Elizabethkingia anophelis TaxID=1117645 RepID=UPI000C9BAAD6|nr:TonB-dependent receptor [Elizabethkingia anophelis]MCT3759638.1 TonB-dependent receptor [Elizabethkingia anophelis]MCT3974451.1 TonB-dependent receptor [Elizabethkingia anophelis]MCT4002844.1 TonB-dependent receptor [Elizabethkingia anophelis]MCT4016864.1 TonB-dependent receptor [Elizabethkingia anophelis]MCT4020543.1 TonB-dependent receptor [Elizabethkingia anophelis]
MPRFFCSILFLFLLFFADNAVAQQYILKGKVVNQSKQPVEFVNISLIKDDKQIVRQTVTDSLGAFSLSAEAGYYILSGQQFNSELFRTNIELNKDTDIGIFKVTDVLELEGVTLEGKKKIIERKFDKLIFNVENSPLRQGYNGLEVLKRSPNLRVNPKGDILLRNESVMVLVNGRKMNFSSEELSNYLNSLNSDDIKSIEIQTLGAAETDASNTGGGVVNIILKKIPIGFKSTIRTSYSFLDKDHGGYTGGITNQFGATKWNIYNKINYSDNSNISRFNSKTDFLTSNGKNDNYGETDFQNKNFNTTTGIVFYPGKRHEIGAEIYYSNSKIQRNGWENLMVYNPVHSATSNNLSLYENQNELWNVTLNYLFKIGEKGSSIKFIGDFGNNKLDNNNEVDTKYTFGSLPDNNYKYLTDAKSTFTNFQVDWLQKFENNWELSLGLKYAGVNRDNLLNVFRKSNGLWIAADGDQNFENTETVFSNYISIAKQWAKKHNLKLGLRTESTKIAGIDNVNFTNVKKNYFDWFPNLYYSYSINDNQSISLSYARKITRPSFRELNPFVIKQNDFLYQTGNPDLQPQYVNRIDVSYSLKKHTFSLFGSFSDDLIVGAYSVNGNITYYKPQNFGKSRMTGFIHSFSGNIKKWLYANISTGVWYYDFEFNNSKHNRMSFYNSLSLQVKFNKTLNLDINNDYTSRTQGNVTEFRNQYSLDLALQKTIYNGAATLRLSWFDVFNTQRDKNVSKYGNFDFYFYSKKITSYPALTFTYNIKNNSKVDNKNIQKGNDNINRL